MQTITRPITEGALLSRLNRKLAVDGERVRKCSERSRHHHNLGSFYLVDCGTNLFLESDVDLEDIGRELGVLAPHEGLPA